MLANVTVGALWPITLSFTKPIANAPLPSANIDREPSTVNARSNIDRETVNPRLLLPYAAAEINRSSL